MKTILSSLNCEDLLRKFRKHLLGNQGLALRTCTARVFYTRQFLHRQLNSSRRQFCLAKLTPEILLHYLLERSRHDSPQSLQALASALRSFMRFLQLRGLTRHDLTTVLPRIASPGRPLLPDYLKADQLKALLACIPTTTIAGLRNYAIILCLVRLGLRAGEVAALTLDQLQWRTGVIRLCGGKGRRGRELPLSREVGQALSRYLQARPKQVGSRRVFSALRHEAPLSSMAISQVAKRALQRAGIPTSRPGAHLLRRTLASHLIQAGVSLKAVADLLGHRSLDTTRIYTGINHAKLREVARPWPTEVSR